MCCNSLYNISVHDHAHLHNINCAFLCDAFCLRIQQLAAALKSASLVAITFGLKAKTAVDKTHQSKNMWKPNACPVTICVKKLIPEGRIHLVWKADWDHLSCSAKYVELLSQPSNEALTKKKSCNCACKGWHLKHWDLPRFPASSDRFFAPPNLHFLTKRMQLFGCQDGSVCVYAFKIPGYSQ